MSAPKPVTVSIQLLPGRDDEILAYKNLPGSNTSDLLRHGGKTLLRQRKGEVDFQAEVLDRLGRIEDGMAQGGTVPTSPPSKKFNQPFLDSED